MKKPLEWRDIDFPKAKSAKNGVCYMKKSLEPDWMPVDSELKTLQSKEFDSTARIVTSPCPLHTYVCVLCILVCLISSTKNRRGNRFYCIF